MDLLCGYSTGRGLEMLLLIVLFRKVVQRYTKFSLFGCWKVRQEPIRTHKLAKQAFTFSQL